MVGDIRNAFYQTMSFNWLFTVQVARHPHHSQSTLRFLLHGLPIVLGPSHAFWKKNFFEHVVADHSSLPQSFYMNIVFVIFFTNLCWRHNYCSDRANSDSPRCSIRTTLHGNTPVMSGIIMLCQENFSPLSGGHVNSPLILSKKNSLPTTSSICINTQSPVFRESSLTSWLMSCVFWTLFLKNRQEQITGCWGVECTVVPLTRLYE